MDLTKKIRQLQNSILNMMEPETAVAVLTGVEEFTPLGSVTLTVIERHGGAVFLRNCQLAVEDDKVKVQQSWKLNLTKRFKGHGQTFSTVVLRPGVKIRSPREGALTVAELSGISYVCVGEYEYKGEVVNDVIFSVDSTFKKRIQLANGVANKRVRKNQTIGYVMEEVRVEFSNRRPQDPKLPVVHTYADSAFFGQPKDVIVRNLEQIKMLVDEVQCGQNVLEELPLQAYIGIETIHKLGITDDNGNEYDFSEDAADDNFMVDYTAMKLSSEFDWFIEFDETDKAVKIPADSVFDSEVRLLKLPLLKSEHAMATFGPLELVLSSPVRFQAEEVDPLPKAKKIVVNL